MFEHILEIKSSARGLRIRSNFGVCLCNRNLLALHRIATLRHDELGQVIFWFSKKFCLYFWGLTVG